MGGEIRGSVTSEVLSKARNDHYETILEELGHSTKDLVELDHWRTLEFPEALKKRYEEEDGKLHISLDELKKLMDWKLKKGKFRPTLKKLIAQNNEDDVVSVSTDAFKLLLDSRDKELKEDDYIKLVKQSLNILIKLRGVGPATASLILSLLNKITLKAPPFFSDESALLLFDDGAKLKYSLTEYIKYLRLFYSINDQFDHDFTELENGAWVLYLKDEFIKDEDPNDKRSQEQDYKEEPKKKRVKKE